MKIAELRAKNQDELKELVVSSKKEMFNLRMQKATGALEKANRFAELRKTIARAKTLMNEKASGKEASPAAKKPVAKKSKKG
jgi:large subunit ribosomal protein L29